MYRYEVLAPAGELNAIVPLIEAGANAIYVGLEGFSSRPQSADFTMKDIVVATQICHEMGIRLHVAINGCISEKVLYKVYEALKKLDDIGVDAIIIADWGVLKNANKCIKNAEIHASTLLGTYNARTIDLLKKMRVTRVIFSTNLYIDEISCIINSVPDMEYEIVADGGICFNDNRICELPHANSSENYTVYCRERYNLLSDGRITAAKRIFAKQISSTEMVDTYLELGVCSFKIEGRTVNYQYIVPRVKRLSQALKVASQQNHSFSSTLHYISERSRLGE